MSIYYKEKPEYVRECFDSLLQQTVKADEWIVIEDGELTPELYQILDEYTEQNPQLLKRIRLEKNMGLGLALREGIMHCTNELIARMDTDDIAQKDRFEKQLKTFERNPDLDICGSHIKEFDESINKILSIRKVPLEDNDIKEYQKLRDAFNHMTVMYKKSMVLKAGNYQHAPLMEDSLLWVNMMSAGAVCKNIDDYLVFVRTDKTMFERRGGLDYFKKYRAGRKMIYKKGFISQFNYLYTIFVQFIVAIVPVRIRTLIFRKLLRDK